MTRRTRIRSWCVAISIAITLGASFGMATEDPDVLFPTCERTATAADIEAAKVAHRAAAQLFDRAEYDRAIENWRDVYKIDCTLHAVLINAASAYERKGDKESAIAALEAYLKRWPEAPDAATIIRRIENLRSSLPPKVDPVPTATPTVTATATATVPRTPPPLPKPQRPYGTKPWILVGVGGVAALAGVIMIPVGFGQIEDAEAACGGRACTTTQGDAADRGNAGRTQVIAGDVALGVGLAAAAGGLIWQIGFNKPRLVKATETPAQEPAGTPKVSVAPVVGPGFGGVAVTGAF